MTIQEIVAMSPNGKPTIVKRPGRMRSVRVLRTSTGVTLNDVMPPARALWPCQLDLNDMLSTRWELASS